MNKKVIKPVLIVCEQNVFVKTQDCVSATFSYFLS